LLLPPQQRPTSHLALRPSRDGVVPGDDEFIALTGVAAETGVVILIYLDNAMTELRAKREAEQQPFTRDDLYAAIMTGAVERVRPKMMNVW
jgi:Cu/Ag efflux pump CusA